jgi:hypothetical protein
LFWYWYGNQRLGELNCPPRASASVSLGGGFALHACSYLCILFFCSSSVGRLPPSLQLPPCRAIGNVNTPKAGLSCMEDTRVACGNDGGNAYCSSPRQMS